MTSSTTNRRSNGSRRSINAFASILLMSNTALATCNKESVHIDSVFTMAIISPLLLLGTLGDIDRDDELGGSGNCEVRSVILVADEADVLADMPLNDWFRWRASAVIPNVAFNDNGNNGTVNDMPLGVPVVTAAVVVGGVVVSGCDKLCAIVPIVAANGIGC